MFIYSKGYCLFVLIDFNCMLFLFLRVIFIICFSSKVIFCATSTFVLFLCCVTCYCCLYIHLVFNGLCIFYFILYASIFNVFVMIVMFCFLLLISHMLMFMFSVCLFLCASLFYYVYYYVLCIFIICVVMIR